MTTCVLHLGSCVAVSVYLHTRVPVTIYISVFKCILVCLLVYPFVCLYFVHVCNTYPSVLYTCMCSCVHIRKWTKFAYMLVRLLNIRLPIFAPISVWVCRCGCSLGGWTPGHRKTGCEGRGCYPALQGSIKMATTDPVIKYLRERRNKNLRFI